METTKMKIEYRKQTDSETAPWQLLTNIDELLWNGVYALRVTADDGSHKLPFRLCDDDTVTIVVKDHAHDGMLENARTVVQTITRVERATGNLLVYTRTRYNAGGTHSWSYWALAGEGSAAVEIPKASKTSAGAVIVGDGLDVDANGKVSLAAGSVGKEQLAGEIRGTVDAVAESLMLAASFVANDGIVVRIGALVENSSPYSGTNYRAYTDKILSNGETLVVNDGYLISTYKIFNGEQEIAFVNNLNLKQFLLDGEHLNYQFEFKKSDTSGFVDGELPMVVKYFQRNPILWSANSRIGNYIAPGRYYIHGNREDVADGLPLNITGAISAHLTVLESESGLAQLLFFVNTDGEECVTDVVVRTRSAAGVWSSWKEINEIKDGSITAQKLSNDIVAQIDSNTAAISAERSRAVGQEQLLNNDLEAEKQRSLQAEKELSERIGYEDAKFVNGDVIVGLAREVYSRQGKTDTATFLKRTTAGGTSISDGVATLKQIGGSVLKNLLGSIKRIAANVKYDISFNNGWTFITAREGYLGDGVASSHVGFETDGYINGHKYYICSKCYSDVDRDIVLGVGYNGYGHLYNFTTLAAGQWAFASMLIDLNADALVPVLSIYPFGVTKTNVIQNGVLALAGGINIIDLTEMYGAGNEPTKEECDRMFATMGTVSRGVTVASPTGFKSTGYNQWNPEKVISGKAIAENALVDADGSIAVVECLPCKVGAGENNGYVIGYGEGESWSDEGVEVYLTPLDPMAATGELFMQKLEKDENSGTYVPQIMGYLLVVAPTTDKLCAHLLWSGDREATDYEPYIESSITLPDIPQMSEWGLAGIAAGVQDTIDLEANKFTKRVGCVDLGALTWYRYEPARYATTGVTMSEKMAGNIQLACDGFTVLPTARNKEQIIALDVKDVVFPVVYDNNINVITGVEYASAEEFKEAVSGVKLYYELAAPEENPIVGKAAPNYIGSDYGVEVFTGSEVPLNANILFYMRSLVSETRNFLDRLMAGLGVSDATAAADRIVAAIIPQEEPEEVPTEGE